MNGISRGPWPIARALAPLEDAALPLRWRDSVYRSAELVDPVWPRTYSAGPFDFSVSSIALLLYVGPFESVAPYAAPVEELVRCLGSNNPDPVGLIGDGLRRRHDLDDESDPISGVFRALAWEHPPVVTALEVASLDQPRHGRPFDWGREWAFYALRERHCSTDTAN